MKAKTKEQLLKDIAMAKRFRWYMAIFGVIYYIEHWRATDMFFINADYCLSIAFFLLILVITVDIMADTTELSKIAGKSIDSQQN